jgi:hypothetical protein
VPPHTTPACMLEKEAIDKIHFICIETARWDANGAGYNLCRSCHDLFLSEMQSARIWRATRHLDSSWAPMSTHLAQTSGIHAVASGRLPLLLIISAFACCRSPAYSASAELSALNG